MGEEKEAKKLTKLNVLTISATEYAALNNDILGSFIAAGVHVTSYDNLPEGMVQHNLAQLLAEEAPEHAEVIVEPRIAMSPYTQGDDTETLPYYHISGTALIRKANLSEEELANY